MKETVLVTALGTAAATAVALTLKESEEYFIIGADICCKEQIATAKDVDEFYVFPPSVTERDAYIEYALVFCKEHEVSFYFATVDEEIVSLSQNRQRFRDAGVHLCIPNASLIEICHYKNRFYRWIEENVPEIAAKNYRDVEAVQNARYPLFVKPIEGRASIGCRKVENPAQLKELLAGGIDFGNHIIQEFLSGEVITVDMARNARTGQKTQLQRVEKLRNSSGCGIAVEIIRDAKLEGICNTLMENLDLNGVVNAEFFRNGDDYRIIEINPRLSAGISFSILAGFNIPLNAIRIAKGEACDFDAIRYGNHMAKRYETYILC